MDEVISSYSAKQAVQDGYMVEILPHRWEQLTGGAPILATSNVFNSISLAGIMEIWNKFVTNRQRHIFQQDQFSTEMNGQEIWVMYDGEAYTIMLPSDY